MKGTLNILKISFFFVFLNFFPANAQKTLESDEIEQYLRSLTTIKRSFETLESQNQTDEEESIPVVSQYDDTSLTPISDNLDTLRNHPTYPDFIDAVKKHGFSSAAEWADVGDRVMNAVAGYYLNNPPPGVDKTIADLIEDMNNQKELIANNKYISSKQKQTLLEKIENRVALLNDPNYINNENIKIIRPYIKRLNSLFEEPQ